MLFRSKLLAPQGSGVSKPKRQPKKRQSSKDNDWKKEAICNTCNKKGHISPDCPEKGKDKTKEVKKISRGKEKKVNKISVEEDNFGGFPDSDLESIGVSILPISYDTHANSQTVMAIRAGKSVGTVELEVEMVSFLMFFLNLLFHMLFLLFLQFLLCYLLFP